MLLIIKNIYFFKDVIKGPTARARTLGGANKLFE